jgi:cytochrome c oxidase assembly protein subunit 15
MNAAHTLHRLALVGVLLCFVVVVLGAYVRLTAAGLGCPDWPGCYGHFTPVGAGESLASQPAYQGNPFDSGKAWREMAHRYAAATLGVLVLVMTLTAIASRGPRPASVLYFLVLLALVVTQSLLGMLTVTWQLKPLIVTLHLLGGLTTLGMLWWLWLGTRERPALRFAGPQHGYRIRLRGVRLAVTVGIAALAVQIALGGWTSSNYAAAACPDVPKCQDGAASVSTTKAACSITPRASPFTSRIASARSSRASRCSSPRSSWRVKRSSHARVPRRSRSSARSCSRSPSAC